MRSHLPRKLLAATLALSVIAASAGVSVLASAPAQFRGKVFDSDGATPLSGVVVSLVDPSTMTTYDSRPTDVDGVFEVDGAPAGTYALLAQAPDVNFLAEGRLALASGANPSVTLALMPLPPDDDPAGTEEGEPEKEVGVEGEEPIEETPPPPPPQKKDGLPTWAKWTIGGAIALGGAGVIYYLNREEDPESPF